MTYASSMSDDEQPNGWLNFLQSLSDAMDSVGRKSAEDIGLRQKLSEDMTRDELDAVEEQSYKSYRYMARALHGAYDALLDAGFDSDQAMEILLLKFERDVWGDPQ